MRLAAQDLDYLDHMWRMTDAEPVRGVNNGKVGESVLRRDNLVTRSLISIVRRTRGLSAPVRPMNISCGCREGFRPSNSSKSTSNTSSSVSASLFLMSHGHSESTTAFTRPVSSSMSRMDVFLRPTKTRLSASPKENGDMSTSCDIENGRRCRGAVGEFEVVT